MRQHYGVPVAQNWCPKIPANFHSVILCGSVHLLIWVQIWIARPNLHRPVSFQADWAFLKDFIQICWLDPGAVQSHIGNFCGPLPTKIEKYDFGVWWGILGLINVKWTYFKSKVDLEVLSLRYVQICPNWPLLGSSAGLGWAKVPGQNGQNFWKGSRLPKTSLKWLICA